MTDAEKLDLSPEQAAGLADTHFPVPGWVQGTRSVLDIILSERYRQVAEYGFNETLEDGTGPDVQWLSNTGLNIEMTAVGIEGAFRREYERYSRQHGLPTWMHLVREEVAEAFKENDPTRLEEELIQVAALCVSWIERLHSRKEPV